MFDLEQAIATWRKAIQAGGIQSAPALDELEDHLREEIVRRVDGGAGVEAALREAQQTLGSESQIQREFARLKAAKVARSRMWKARIIRANCLLYLVLGSLLSFSRPGVALTTGERINIFAVFTLGAVMLMAWRPLVRFLPAITNTRARTYACLSLLVPTFAWVAAFAYGILPRFDFTEGQVVVVILWSLVPMSAVVASLGFALEEAAEVRMTAPVQQ